MKWDEMSPRERDALVAEKVMGFTVYEDFPVNAVHTWTTPTSFRVFRPSTDISAAWEVVEKMRGYRKEVMRYATYGWDIFDVTPEAICLAALRAMGVDV